MEQIRKDRSLEETPKTVFVRQRAQSSNMNIAQTYIEGNENIEIGHQTNLHLILK